MRILLILFICLCGILSCNVDDADTSVEGSASFFAIEAFLDQEIQRLQSSNTTLQKTVFIDGKQEQQDITEPDFDQELTLFRDLDINRPIWQEKYRIDTLTTATDKIITYEAKAEDLNTQFLQILYNEDGQIKEIKGTRKNQSALSSSLNSYSYQPTTGYSINSIQSNRTGEEITIRIEGKFRE